MSQYSVEDFAQFLKNAKEENKPYVLFTGAGCSLSAGIPLAGELVKEINEKYAFAVKSLSEEDRQNYGKCMAVITGVFHLIVYPLKQWMKINQDNI